MGHYRTNAALPINPGMWEHRGYSGGGNVEGLLGSLAGRPALVCGNAESVFGDIAEATKLMDDPVIFAANDIGMYLPKVDHWMSLHKDNMQAWAAVRHAQRNKPAEIHSMEEFGCIKWGWAGLNPTFALSGYFAMQVAWLMGCEPIVLCGCPGEPARRFFEAKPRDNFGYGGGTAGADEGIKRQLVMEMRRVPEFKAAVRSMSGETREFFGKLT